MKLTPDSPEITAYALGEVSPEDHAIIERAIAESPELRAEIASLRRLADTLETQLAAEPAPELDDARREAIIEAAADPAKAASVLAAAAPSGGPLHWFSNAWSLLTKPALGFSLAAATALAIALAIWTPWKVRESETVSDEPRYTANKEKVQKAEKAVAEQQQEFARDAKDLPTAKADALSELKSAAPVQKRAELSDAASPRGRGDLPVNGPATFAEKRVEPGLAGGAQQQVPGDLAANGSILVTGGQPINRSSQESVRPQDPATSSANTPLAGAVGGGAALDGVDQFGAAVHPSSVGTPVRRKLAADSMKRESEVRGYQQPAEAAPGTRYAENFYAAPPVANNQLGRRPLAREQELGAAVKLQEAKQPSKADPMATRYGKQDPLAIRYGLIRRADEKNELSEKLADQVSSEVALNYVPQSRPSLAESYARIAENPFKDVTASPLSTFGMDADTASYANVRRFLREGSVPPADSVRLEELVNYFPYDYAAPRGPEPFAANVEVADCPWNPEHRLVRVGLKARESDRRERPRANLVFLVDVSGSMQPENKLPLVQRSLRLLLDQLDAKDQVGIVTYAGEARVALEPTTVSEKPAIARVIDSLKAGSGTHGSAGIQQAYAMATNRFIKGGINRVILCTDGDFNIGLTSREDLLDLITEKAKSGVFLSVLGYGMDNYKDDTAELLADRGNGNYSYVDSFTEARKVLREEVQGTLQTVAKDAKVQVEFNPARVASWRLLGYENRVLADRDFNDDKKDAGEIGAGHAVTALYEIVPVGGRRAGVDPLRYDARSTKEKADPVPHNDELLNLKLRYKDPEGDKSQLMQVPVKDQDREAAAATADYKFAAAVVGYGMMLRDSQFKGDLTWDKVLKLAEEGLGPDREGYRAEFIDLVRRARQLRGGK